jgi:hypothetical protein
MAPEYLFIFKGFLKDEKYFLLVIARYIEETKCAKKSTFPK